MANRNIPLLTKRRTAMLIVVLSACLFVWGCRGLSSRSPKAVPAEAPPFTGLDVPPTDPAPALILGTPAAASPTTNYKPPIITEAATMAEGISITERPVPESSFKPVVPQHLRHESVPTTPLDAPLPVASQSVAPAANDRVDELNRRVAELEKSLAASEAEVQKARQTAEEAVRKAAATSTVSPLPVVATKVARKAPVLNLPGVTAVSEDGRIRFRIVDKVVFVPGTNRINPEAEETFRKIVAEIRNIDPNANLEIEGHTDGLNTDPANPMQKHEVSSVKSVVVMEYFVKSLLWSNQRIRTSAHGPSRPIGDNGTPDGRAANNRIEIVVLEN